MLMSLCTLRQMQLRLTAQVWRRNSRTQRRILPPRTPSLPTKVRSSTSCHRSDKNTQRKCKRKTLAPRITRTNPSPTKVRLLSFPLNKPKFWLNKGERNSLPNSLSHTSIPKFVLVFRRPFSDLASKSSRSKLAAVSSSTLLPRISSRPNCTFSFRKSLRSVCRRQSVKASVSRYQSILWPNSINYKSRRINYLKRASTRTKPLSISVWLRNSTSFVTFKIPKENTLTCLLTTPTTMKSGTHSLFSAWSSTCRPKLSSIWTKRSRSKALTNKQESC